VTFDGTNDEITIPHSAALEPDDLTLSVWVKRNGTQGTNDQIIGKDTSASGSNTWSYALEWDSGGTAIQWEVDDNSLASFPFVTSAVIPDATWTLVTGTYKYTTKTLELFVNGVSQGTTALPGTRDKGTTGIVLGRYNGGGGEFNGSIDDVRIYNRALSAEEVADLYRLTTPTGVDTGLKGYWSFNGQDMNGTTAYDRSGSGNNGTLTNGPTKTIGKIGQGLSFAYDDDNYISVADVPSLQNIAQKTICAWIYPRSTGSSANDATIVSKSESSSSYGWYLQLADDSVANAVYFLQAFSGGSALWVTPANSIVLNTWQHVCVTYDDSSASNNPTIYINAASQSLSGGGASGSVRSDVGYILDIGNRSTSPSNGSFDGVIDDVRIYNRILSSTEISSLYNMGR
jgi:hypothetical protein